MRVGIGYDVHALVIGQRLILGGVEIPHTMGLEGHSDADVAIHALIDALLGAAALGDIGSHFPDNDSSYKGADSRELLKVSYQKVCSAGYKLGNADITIIAQQPKLRPYISQMIHNIAETLEVDVNQISVKATTTEKLGFAGREEGIAAEAITLLLPSKT